MDRRLGKFVWSIDRERDNIAKHGISFETAAKAFLDPNRKVFTDSGHSINEPRYFCIGRVESRIMTVRFTYREGYIRIFGAGYWRKGRQYYVYSQKE